MDELLDDLRRKREDENIEAEKHRELRDQLNDETRKWADRRDELNSQVRTLIDQALEHRRERDALNDEVRDAKENRDLWNKKYLEFSEKANTLKRQKLPKNGMPLGKLKKELKDLEFKQMTSVLTIEKEKELIELLSKLQAQIKEREQILEMDEEIRNVMRETNRAKQEAEKYHKIVFESAEQAQKEHDAMLDLYEQANKLRKDADEAQVKFIEVKLIADEEHKKHIEHLRRVHDYDKIIFGLRQKEEKTKKYKEESAAKKEAEAIFERFKQGEKLSTEDLMTLQKSGYI